MSESAAGVVIDGEETTLRCIVRLPDSGFAVVNEARPALTARLHLAGRQVTLEFRHSHIRFSELLGQLADGGGCQATVLCCTGCGRRLSAEEEPFQLVPAGCCRVRSQVLREVEPRGTGPDYREVEDVSCQTERRHATAETNTDPQRIGFSQQHTPVGQLSPEVASACCQTEGPPCPANPQRPLSVAAGTSTDSKMVFFVQQHPPVGQFGPEVAPQVASVHCQTEGPPYAVGPRRPLSVAAWTNTDSEMVFFSQQHPRSTGCPPVGQLDAQQLYVVNYTDFNCRRNFWCCVSLPCPARVIHLREAIAMTTGRSAASIRFQRWSGSGVCGEEVYAVREDGGGGGCMFGSPCGRNYHRDEVMELEWRSLDDDEAEFVSLPGRMCVILIEDHTPYADAVLPQGVPIVDDSSSSSSLSTSSSQSSPPDFDKEIAQKMANYLSFLMDMVLGGDSVRAFLQKQDIKVRLQDGREQSPEPSVSLLMEPKVSVVDAGTQTLRDSPEGEPPGDEPLPPPNHQIAADDVTPQLHGSTASGDLLDERNDPARSSPDEPLSIHNPQAADEDVRPQLHGTPVTGDLLEVTMRSCPARSPPGEPLLILNPPAAPDFATAYLHRTQRQRDEQEVALLESRVSRPRPTTEKRKSKSDGAQCVSRHDADEKRDQSIPDVVPRPKPRPPWLPNWPRRHPMPQPLELLLVKYHFYVINYTKYRGRNNFEWDVSLEYHFCVSQLRAALAQTLHREESALRVEQTTGLTAEGRVVVEVCAEDPSTTTFGDETGSIYYSEAIRRIRKVALKIPHERVVTVPERRCFIEVSEVN